MENVLDILTKYKEKGIRIGLDGTGENLSIKGELSGLSDLDKVELRSSKELLLSFLQGQKQQSLEHTLLPLGKQVPLSPSQKGIWFHSRIEDNDTMYLIPSVYDFVVPGLNQEDLLTAAEVFVAAHPILASVFGEKEGEPYQQLTVFESTNHLFFENLSQLSITKREEECAEKIRLSMQKGFDLTTKAPWSITVFDLGEDQYRFFVKIHHLIADGATLGLLVGGLVEAYELQQKGEIYHYTGTHHHDYVAWITDKTHQQRSSNFWKTYLEHYPDDLEFSTRVLVHETSSATSVEQSLPLILREKTAQFSIAHNIPLSQLFTFSFGIVLSKYGRQNDVIIGTPVEGRTHPDFQKMLGDLVNTIPVRLSLNYEVSVLENLQIFGQGYLSVLDHQQYPFEYILDDIGYQRQADRFPLFNTMVSFPNNQELGRKNENELKLAKEQALYDLTLSLIELADSTELQLEFDQKKFSAEYASGLLEQTLTVLEQVVNSAQTVLSEISLLTEIERKVYLEKGLPKAETKPTHVTAVEAITAIISKSPESIAVVEVETTYSYAALQLKSQAVAWTLSQKGIQPGDRVVVELPSGIDLLATMLGIWQMGGVYVPIGTELPTTRKEEILQDSGAVIVIDALFVETLSQTTDQRVEQFSENLAYILYTSGSTGKPKGVAISHGALLNKLMEEAALVKTTTLTTLTLTSPTFDVSLLELILPLTMGGTVVVAKDKSNAAVFESILQNKVTVLQGTPTYFSHLESELDEAAAQMLNETLELLCIGGESLNDALVKRLKRKLPAVRINNHYGPTEITIDALVKEDVSEFKENSLGRPFGNTGVIIVDDYDNVLPENVPGELLITGPSLARSYWNNERETAAKFSNSEKLGISVYRTGDLATWSKEGEIHFIGRKDKQVKYRGYRIELEEINARLREIVGIRDAYTLVISNVLVSWIATDGVDETLIREHLQQTLPEYMLPTVYEQLSALPMNANGKTDEKQLPQPQSLKAEYVAPRNELEEQLVQIWQEVLGVERVGIYDNFFELGGHSLNLLSVKNKVENRLQVGITLSYLFKNPYIANHSLFITENRNTEVLTIPAINEQEFYPLSNAQLRMWSICQDHKAVLAYQMPGKIKLPKEESPESIVKHLEKLVSEHEILRTVFVLDSNAVPMQKILPMEHFSIDHSNFELNEDVIGKHLQSALHIGFDLQNGPLFRTALVKNEESYLYFNFHHLICDGISLEIFKSDLLKLIHSDQTTDRISFSTQKIKYKDFAVWQSNQDSAIHRDYWKRRFDGEWSRLELAGMLPRPRKNSYNGHCLTKSLGATLSQKLRDFTKNHGVSLFSGLLGSWSVLYSIYSGQKSFVLGCPIDDRINSQLENLIGMFVETIAYRTTVNFEETFSQLLIQTNNTFINDRCHSSYPLHEIVRDLALPRNGSRDSILDVVISLQNYQASYEEGLFNSYCAETVIDIGDCFARFDQEISFVENDGVLVYNMVYNSDLYEQKQMEEIMSNYHFLLEQLIENAHRSLADISVIHPKKAVLLRNGINHQEIPAEHTMSIPILFQQHVNSTPNSIALVDADGELNYHELNALSNRFAHYLHECRNVNHGNTVIVNLSRSRWVVIAELAILKLGAVYVPIEPDYPQERRTKIEETTKAVACVDTAMVADFSANSLGFGEMPPEIVCSQEDLAYIIFTSGSTGEPKGAMVRHKSVINLVANFQFIPLNHQTKMLPTGAISFDSVTFEIWGAILNGGTVVITSKDQLLDPDKLANIIEKEEVNTMWFTASYFNRLVEDKPELFATLKFIIVGGERLSPKFIEILHKRYPDLRIVNGYGPTEATTFTLCHEIVNCKHEVPLGTPVSNASVFILDERGNILPPYAKGTLFIGGIGVAKGYVNDPEMTDQKFVTLPSVHPDKIYNSGDLCYYDSDGIIHFIGRNDFQAKINGFRVDTSEIENALMKIQGIQEARVFTKSTTERRFLKAYCRTQNQSVVTIRKELRNLLPKYMMPESIIILEHFPITANGKTDYEALDKLSVSTFAAEDETQQLDKAFVDVIWGIWDELLPAGSFDSKTNFFDAGGSSIGIMRLRQRIFERLSVQMEIADLFEFSSIDGIAGYISEIKFMETDPTTLQIKGATSLNMDTTIDVTNKRKQLAKRKNRVQ